jgi:type 1 glutamine amidotransferase
MFSRRAARFASAALLLGLIAGPGRSAEPVAQVPGGIVREEQPQDPGLVKIVLVAGSSVYKPGEHDYLAGCAVLMDLLRQSPGVFPVLAVDWPEKPETFAGARAVVLFCDGGDKHPFLKQDHLAQIQRLADKGAGLVALHQVDDVPKDLGDFARALLGAAWEQGFSQRAHWVAKFATFPDHPITRGVTPFTIDDGWLYRLRFVPDLAGVTPLLRTVSPKAPAASDSDPGSASIVSWAYDRPGDGRSFVFTGGHLHRSLAEEGYRRFLVNGILWSAHVEVPDSGAPVALAPAALKPTPDPQLPRKDP